MNIQELHGWPQPRERTSHMIGRSLGETLQGASNLYLQNKIQGYFDQQKEQRQLAADAQQRRQTAQAYENLTGIKGLAQKLEGMPIQFQEKALSEYGGGNQMLPWNQPVTAPSGTNRPINPPVNVPTAQKITGDIATAQRMGLTGEGGEGQEEGLEGTSGLPLGIGMPTPRGKALQGQAPQYQEAPIPQTPSGTIPPKPISGYPLADMSNEDFLQYLNTIPSQSGRKEVYQAREKEKAAQRDERNTIARESKGAREERKERREAEVKPREYLKSLNDQYNSTLKTKNIYKILEKKAPELQDNSVLKKYIQTKFHLPAGWLFDTTGQSLDKLSEQLMRGISGTYKGKILQSEVENWAKSNPSLFNTKEGMVALSKLSLAQDKLIEKQWEEANRIRNEAKRSGTPLPEDLESLVMEKSAGYNDAIYDEMAKILGVDIGTPGKVRMVSPDGVVGEVPNENIDEALKLGYILK